MIVNGITIPLPSELARSAAMSLTTGRGSWGSRSRIYAATALTRTRERNARRGEIRKVGAVLRERREREDAPGRNRTCDLALRRRALYPLSYRRGGV